MTTLSDQVTAALCDPRTRALISRAIHSTGLHHDVEDAIQDTLLKAFKYRDKYDGRTKVTSWIYGIARNKAIDYLRKKTRRRISCEFNERMFSSPERSAEAIVADRDELMYVLAEIGQQSAVHEQPGGLVEHPFTDTHLHGIEMAFEHGCGFSYKEIGKKHDIPIGTVKTRMHRGREAAREIRDGRGSR